MIRADILSQVAKQTQWGVAVESGFALSKAQSPMLGRGILGKGLHGNLFSHLEAHGEGVARIRSTTAHVWADVLHVVGSKRSFNPAQQMHAAREGPLPITGSTQYMVI